MDTDLADAANHTSNMPFLDCRFRHDRLFPVEHGERPRMRVLPGTNPF
jgi:hypothetical protein